VGHPSSAITIVGPSFARSACADVLLLAVVAVQWADLSGTSAPGWSGASSSSGSSGSSKDVAQGLGAGAAAEAGEAAAAEEGGYIVRTRNALRKKEVS